MVNVFLVHNGILVKVQLPILANQTPVAQDQQEVNVHHGRVHEYVHEELLIHVYQTLVAQDHREHVKVVIRQIPLLEIEHGILVVDM